MYRVGHAHDFQNASFPLHEVTSVQYVRRKTAQSTGSNHGTEAVDSPGGVELFVIGTGFDSRKGSG